MCLSPPVTLTPNCHVASVSFRDVYLRRLSRFRFLVFALWLPVSGLWHRVGLLFRFLIFSLRSLFLVLLLLLLTSHHTSHMLSVRPIANNFLQLVQQQPQFTYFKPHITIKINKKTSKQENNHQKISFSHSFDHISTSSFHIEESFTSSPIITSPIITPTLIIESPIINPTLIIESPIIGSTAFIASPIITSSTPVISSALCPCGCGDAPSPVFVKATRKVPPLSWFYNRVVETEAAKLSLDVSLAPGPSPEDIRVLSVESASDPSSEDTCVLSIESVSSSSSTHSLFFRSGYEAYEDHVKYLLINANEAHLSNPAMPMTLCYALACKDVAEELEPSHPMLPWLQAEVDRMAALGNPDVSSPEGTCVLSVESESAEHVEPVAPFTPVTPVKKSVVDKFKTPTSERPLPDRPSSGPTRRLLCYDDCQPNDKCHPGRPSPVAVKSSARKFSPSRVRAARLTWESPDTVDLYPRGGVLPDPSPARLRLGRLLAKRSIHTHYTGIIKGRLPSPVKPQEPSHSAHVPSDVPSFQFAAQSNQDSTTSSESSTPSARSYGPEESDYDESCSVSISGSIKDWTTAPQVERRQRIADALLEVAEMRKESEAKNAAMKAQLALMMADAGLGSDDLMPTTTTTTPVDNSPQLPSVSFVDEDGHSLELGPEPSSDQKESRFTRCSVPLLADEPPRPASPPARLDLPKVLSGWQSLGLFTAVAASAVGVAAAVAWWMMP